MCYHGNELQDHSRTHEKLEENNHSDSMYKEKGNPTYAGHLPNKQ